MLTVGALPLEGVDVGTGVGVGVTMPASDAWTNTSASPWRTFSQRVSSFQAAPSTCSITSSAWPLLKVVTTAQVVSAQARAFTVPLWLTTQTVSVG